jgi:hypothetical protein
MPRGVRFSAKVSRDLAHSASQALVLVLVPARRDVNLSLRMMWRGDADFAKERHLSRNGKPFECRPKR